MHAMPVGDTGGSGSSNPSPVFISYAHEDDVLRGEFVSHIKLLERIGLIEAWYDRLVRSGADWNRAIAEKLESAHIIVLLLSADYFNSDFCCKEMQLALERRETGRAVVIPVIVRPVAWQHVEGLAILQVLPTEGTPVTLWPNRDLAWSNVAEGIWQTAGKIQVK